jgi:hypothetical protein
MRRLGTRRLRACFFFPLDANHRLRLIEDRDAEELYRVVAANRATLAAWMPWAAGQTLAGIREFIGDSWLPATDCARNGGARLRGSLARTRVAAHLIPRFH